MSKESRMTWPFGQDHQAHNPLRPPDWRWQLACEIVGQGGRAGRNESDPWLAAAIELRRMLGGATGTTDDGTQSSGQVEVLRAHAIYNHGGYERWRLEAWLLTGVSSDQIGVKCGLPTAVVEAFEAAFYDVREHLAAREYVRCRLIGLKRTQGRPSLETVVKNFAFNAGALVLDVIISSVLDMHGRLRPAQEMNLTTPEGRTAAKARLSIMAEMLPANAALIRETKLFRELIKRFERAETAEALLAPVFASTTDGLMSVVRRQRAIIRSKPSWRRVRQQMVTVSMGLKGALRHRVEWFIG